MSISVLIMMVAAVVFLRAAHHRSRGSEWFARITRLEGRVDELSARGGPTNDSQLAREVERLEERIDWLEKLLAERPKGDRLPPGEE